MSNTELSAGFAYQAEKEKRQPINPEYEAMMKRDRELWQEHLDTVKDERGPGEPLWGFEYDEKGNLNNLRANGTYRGMGRLGALLQKESIEYHGSADPFDPKFQPRPNKPNYIIEASKTNPEVKAILEKIISIEKERERIKEKKKEVLVEKENRYVSGAAINEFLQKMGIDKKVPDNFDMERTLHMIQETDPSDQKALVAFAKLLVRLTDPFENLWRDTDSGNVIGNNEGLDDYGVDLKAIQKNMDKIFRALRGRLFHTYTQEGNDRDIQTDKMMKDVFTSGKVTKALYYVGSASSGWMAPREYEE